MSKIVNKTDWDTLQLQKLTRAVIKHTGSHKNHHIEVIHAKDNWFTGYAYIHGRFICMRVPKPKQTKYVQENGKITKKSTDIKFDSIKYAQVLEHEIGHNLGLRHKDMVYSTSINADYAKDFVVEPKKPKPKKERDLVKERYDKTRKKVAEYTTKLKRTKNLLKKWQKKQKYYEKKISSSPCL